ncbi:glycoside hydrolase family 88/105 protein [Aspergillus mulundensis]|uniref:Putative Unsaturated rhamnogalacturonan hydrolase n=1 Tax=Aspergillus mulundensis TaxID=1810919 RepID=A0A3D8RZ67_9EURO|nr:putative Unsaturated rhamnogalacturonan hydrolase [Aspergillus mulundensis]RDW79332.1 putative Unsaturated rhamnogalacturonan hydrolase [Aspergillus mulundensis]
MRLATLALLAAPAAAAKSYLSWMADSWILNNREDEGAYWYGRATIYEGYEAAYELYGNETLLSWYHAQIDDIVNEDGSIVDFNETYYSLDDYRIGNNFLYWYERTGEEKFRLAADRIRAMLDRHPRTETGGFWHRQPVYPNQMWLDGIFMADVFYAKWTKLFDAKNRTAWDDIVLQWDKIEAVTRDPGGTGLLVHGFDESKTAIWADPVTGASPLVWNRAVGWYFVSLIEVLDIYPKHLPGYKRLLGYYKRLAGALKEAQDPKTDGWYLVLSKEYIGAEGNYFESSAAAMFTYGWLAGLRRGYLDERKFSRPAAKAYRHLIDDFVTKHRNGTLTWEGTVQVGSLNSNATFEYYTSIPVVPNDTRGVGPFLLAAYEWELRQKHK